MTARPEILGWQTELNLQSVGYPIERVYLRPWFNTQPDAELKADARKAIEAQGYRIVANIGNSPSDLSGGHADRTFKLPDYDGQLV
ncbi:HAD family acid phosphatase [Actinoplanes sp. NPDC051475]|uniref:HAD family acid phosphatase n=1 Tax=Actinoplanes sp. NPDC051475 TaxID=3157225 RepID=UPI00344FA6A2